MTAGAGALSQRGFAVPDDDVSLGELGRRLEAMRVDIKDDIHDLAKRLDAKVSLERYQLERDAHDKAVNEVASRVARLEQTRHDDQRARIAERKWLLASFIFPTVVVIIALGLQVVLSVLGVL